MEEPTLEDIRASIEREIEYAKNGIVQNAQRLSWIEKNRSLLEEIGVAPDTYAKNINFFNCSHEMAIALIKAFPAKFEKTYEDGAVKYSAQVDGFDMRIDSEPPKACKIVEYEEEVPEQIIPAHKVTKRKIECPNQGSNQSESETALLLGATA